MIDINCEPEDVRVRLTDWSESLSERVVRDREGEWVCKPTVISPFPVVRTCLVPKETSIANVAAGSDSARCPIVPSQVLGSWEPGDIIILVSVLFCPVKPSNGLGSRTQAWGHRVWCSTEVPTERCVDRAGVQCMYRSDKLLSNGPWAAGETQVPISGLDRSIPFRCCQARPAGLGATCTRI